MPLGELHPEFSNPWNINGKVDTRYTVPILSGVGIHQMRLVYWLLVMPLVFPIGNQSECLWETSTQNIAAPWYTYAKYDTRYIVPMWSGVGIENMRLIRRLLVMPLVFQICSHSECLWEICAQNSATPDTSMVKLTLDTLSLYVEWSRNPWDEVGILTFSYATSFSYR